MHSRNALRFTALLLAIAGSASAQRTVYTDEASFRSALAANGLVEVREGFENPQTWSLLQTSASTPVSAPDVVSAGVTWTGLGGAVALDSLLSKDGDWELTSSPAGFPRNGILGTASMPLRALGGWVRSAGFTPNDIELVLDGDTANPIGTHGQGITSTFFFFGVIDLTGFTTFEFHTEPVQAPDPPKVLEVDAFTFGFDALPPATCAGPSWASPVTGSWSDPMRWDTGLPPTPTECAHFETGALAPYTVSTTAPSAADRVIVGNDTLRLDSLAGTLDLASFNLTREGLVLGLHDGESAQLELVGGALSTSDAAIPHAPLASGDLVVSLGGQLALAGTLRVGHLGTGSVEVLDGSVTSLTSEVGRRGGTGRVHVSGPGAVWSSGFLRVGMGGTGTIQLDGAASAVANSITTSELAGTGLPGDTGGSADITVTGPGTSLDVASTIALGLNGPASLSVLQGGQLTAKSMDLATGGDVPVVVDGPGTVLDTRNSNRYGVGRLRVGIGTHGGVFVSPPPPLRSSSITVSGGAALLCDEATLASGTDSAGSILVTGPGSSFTNTDNCFVGYLGNGTIRVSGGASASSGQLIVGRFLRKGLTKGEVIIEGPGSRWDATAVSAGLNNDVSLYSPITEGVITVRDGGTLHGSLNLTVADRWTTDGTVRVEGPGSLCDMAYWVAIGRTQGTSIYKSHGLVEVVAGGTLRTAMDVFVRSGELVLDGGTVDATGTVQVDPEGLLLGRGTLLGDVRSNDGMLGVGSTGPGRLSISGDLVLSNGTTTGVELDGKAPGSFQQYAVGGAATLRGALEVHLGAGFQPVPGDRFQILTCASRSGRFQGIVPPAGSGLSWKLIYGNDRVVLVAQDPNAPGGLPSPKGGLRPHS